MGRNMLWSNVWRQLFTRQLDFFCGQQAYFRKFTPRGILTFGGASAPYSIPKKLRLALGVDPPMCVIYAKHHYATQPITHLQYLKWTPSKPSLAIGTRPSTGVYFAAGPGR
eukprot:scaffold34899_cov49-Cyclotella_meneghiniana.AAC.2